MRILMITHGSRGDVQPFAALAKVLTESGHSVTLAAPSASIALARPYCDELFELHDGPNELASDAEVVKGLETQFSGLGGKKRMIATMRKARRMVALFLDDIAKMALELKSRKSRHDLLLHHVSTPAHHVAELLGIPSVLMCPQPYWVPTDAFPDPSMPFRVPPRLNTRSYVASRAVLWAFSGDSINWRWKSLGMDRRHVSKFRQADGSPTTVLHAFSEHILPPDTGYPSWVHNTGFWFLPTNAEWTPPRELSAFLDAGAPPVYLGFASFVSSDPRRLGRLVTRAVELAGVRAVVVGGWSGVNARDFEGDIAFLDEAPFDWLFSRVSAVVHHGGLGTTGTALSSGRPQVVCPSMPDQWFSARRMHALGVAPKPIPQRELTATGLADAIRAAAQSSELATKAAAVGSHVNAEQGAVGAAHILENLVRRSRESASAA